MNFWGFDDDSVSRFDRAQRWATIADRGRLLDDESIGVGGTIALVLVGVLIGLLIGAWLVIAFPTPPLM